MKKHERRSEVMRISSHYSPLQLLVLHSGAIKPTEKRGGNKITKIAHENMMEM